MGEYVLRICDEEYRAEVHEMTAERARVTVNGEEFVVDLVHFGHSRPSTVQVQKPPGPTPTPMTATTAPPQRPSRPGVRGSVPAPLPGLVLELKVTEGQSVQAGQPLLLMEAMKMENVIQAPHNGTVKKIFVTAGDAVGEGDVLVEISRPEMTTL